jgi:hypothetical protein
MNLDLGKIMITAGPSLLGLKTVPRNQSTKHGAQ